MYKMLIPSRCARRRVLHALSFIPDAAMLHLQYFIKFYRPLNLKNPQRFSEKLQWYKLYYRNRLMTQCVDKVGARDYVKSRGLGCYLIPAHAIYKTPEELDLNSLPEKFVLKFSNGAQRNVFCYDKNQVDWSHTMKEVRAWFREPSGLLGREWSYYDVQPRLLVESLLEPVDGGIPEDYKFFCFDGQVAFLYVIRGRFSKGGIRLGIFDREFNKIKVNRKGIRSLEHAENPKNFDKMVEVAERLSSGFPHVRVDLYNLSGAIYFGELTFYSASGYAAFEPDSFDRDIGRLFTLPEMTA